MKQGIIYIIHAEETEYYKIGFCEEIYKLQNRIKSLQTGCPYALMVKAVIREQSRRDESRLHRKFKQSRIRGEWFSYCEGIEKIIDKYAKEKEEDKKGLQIKGSKKQESETASVKN